MLSAAAAIDSTQGLRLVSVIIPCDKQAQMLGDSVGSTLAQTYPNVETIVVDDGSPDNVAEAMVRFPGVECIHQKNQGVHEARNTGIRASSGDYLMFRDADGRLTPASVELHRRCLEAQPEVGFVVGEINQISLGGEIIRQPRWCPAQENGSMSNSCVWTTRRTPSLQWSAGPLPKRCQASTRGTRSPAITNFCCEWPEISQVSITRE